jgi:hypothetical protein
MSFAHWSEKLTDPKKCLTLMKTYLFSGEFNDLIREMIQQNLCPDLSAIDDKTKSVVVKLVNTFGYECLDWCINGKLNLDYNTVLELLNRKHTNSNVLPQIIQGDYDGVTVKILVDSINKSRNDVNFGENFQTWLDRVIVDLNIDLNEFLEELLNTNSHNLPIYNLHKMCIKYCLDLGTPIDFHIDTLINVTVPCLAKYTSKGGHLANSKEWWLLWILHDLTKDRINVNNIFEIFSAEKPSNTNRTNLLMLTTFIKNKLDINIPHINDYVFNVLSTTDFDGQYYFRQADGQLLFGTLIQNADNNKKYEYFKFVLQWLEMSDADLNLQEMQIWIGNLGVDLVQVVEDYLDDKIECCEYSMAGFIFPLVKLGC